MNKLTLIIPVKNEKESLPKVLEELSKYDCKKLVIIDPMNKDTYEKIKEYECKIITSKKTGYGNAIIEGMNSVDTEILCIFNADGSFNPIYLNQMLKLIEQGNDFIFSSRYLEKGGSEDDTFITYIGNKIFSFIGNFLFKLNLSDILFTFVMGKTQSFRTLNLESKDFRLCVEIPIKLKNIGFKYNSIPCFERSRFGGKKKVNELIDGFLIFLEILKLYLRIKINFNGK